MKCSDPIALSLNVGGHTLSFLPDKEICSTVGDFRIIDKDSLRSKDRVVVSNKTLVPNEYHIGRSESYPPAMKLDRVSRAEACAHEL